MLVIFYHLSLLGSLSRSLVHIDSLKEIHSQFTHSATQPESTWNVQGFPFEHWASCSLSCGHFFLATSDRSTVIAHTDWLYFLCFVSMHFCLAYSNGSSAWSSLHLCSFMWKESNSCKGTLKNCPLPLQLISCILFYSLPFLLSSYSYEPEPLAVSRRIERQLHLP